MTIEQKRRELFEAWDGETFGSTTEEQELCEDGSYVDTVINQCWLAFNAALDAVVIEFVEEYKATETGEHAQQVALVANCMLDDCRAAIESTGLGLKIK